MSGEYLGACAVCRLKGGNKGNTALSAGKISVLTATDVLYEGPVIVVCNNAYV